MCAVYVSCVYLARSPQNIKPNFTPDLRLYEIKIIAWEKKTRTSNK